MSQFLNHNSALLAFAAIIVLLGWIAWDYRRSKPVVAGIVVLVLVLVGGYSQARHGPSDASSLAEFESFFTGGTPVVLEVLSDNCALCLASRPAVATLERQLEGHAVVLRMNINEEVGREVAQKYRALATPTFIVFSSRGVEQYRASGYPNVSRLEAEAKAAG